MGGRGGGHHFMGHDFIVLAFEDLVDLTNTLREAFPRIRFYASPDNEDPNVDWAATLAMRKELRARGVPDNPFDPDNPLYKFVPKPSSQCRIPYVEGLEQTEVDSLFCYAWVEPEGWVPFWGLTERDFPIVVNAPEFGFRLNYSFYGGSRKPLHARSDDESAILRSGNWHGSYYDGKPHQKAFLAKVKRIFAKQTVNKYTQIDRETGAVIVRDEHGGPLRFGLHALEWARAHRNHYLDGRFKPIDWNPP